MSKTLMPVVLATLMLAASGASAAPKRSDASATSTVLSRVVTPQAGAYARELASSSKGAGLSDGWNDRSLFYQGPTYIGRY